MASAYHSADNSPVVVSTDQQRADPDNEGSTGHAGKPLPCPEYEEPTALSRIDLTGGLDVSLMHNSKSQVLLNMKNSPSSIGAKP